MIQLINIFLSVLAAGFVMIIHEFIKAVVYVAASGHGSKIKGIFNLIRYIDPIGLILFLTCGAGFSRPYSYTLKSKKSNLAIGLAGFLSMAFTALVGCYLYWTLDISSYGVKIFIYYMVMFSVALFMVNLVPIITSDMALVVLAVAPGRLITLMKNEALIKGLLLLLIILGVAHAATIRGVNFLNSFVVAVL